MKVLLATRDFSTIIRQVYPDLEIVETPIRKKIKDMSLKDYDSIMNVNLKGMFLCTKYALPYLEKQKEAIIINISSGAGRSGIPELGVYCASKFGVIGFQ